MGEIGLFEEAGFDIACYAPEEFQEARHAWPDIVRIA